MKKLLPLLLVFLLATGCTTAPAGNNVDTETAAPGNTATPPETTTFATIATLDNVTWTTTAESEKPEDGFAHAVGLKDVGLKLTIPENGLEIHSPYYKEKNYDDQISAFFFFDEKNGQLLSNDPCVLIRANLAPLDSSPTEFEYMEVLAFQLFRKEDLDKYGKIIACRESLALDEIKTRIIYEDDNFIGYDMTDYRLGERYDDVPITFEDYAKKVYPDGHPDLEWATSVRKYYLENLDKALVAMG